MLKSKRLIGMPVISLAEGQQLGKVKDLIVDPLKRAVAALVIEQKGWFREEKFIPYSKVSNVGSDAITVAQSDFAQKGTSLPEIVKLMKDKYLINNTKVVAENGKMLGIVEEYYINTEDGTIAGLEIAGNFLNSIISGRAFLDSSFIRTIGKELIIVGDEAVDNLVKTDGGLKETMKTIKESSNTIWGETLVKAKEVSSSINKKLEQLKERKKKQEEHSECQCSEQAPELQEVKNVEQKESSETEKTIEAQKEQATESQPEKNNPQPPGE